MAANLALHKELQRVSGWFPRSGTSTTYDRKTGTLIYSFDFVATRLSKVGHLSEEKIGDRFRVQVGGYGIGPNAAEAETARDASVMLALELFKQGVLKRATEGTTEGEKHA